MNRKNLRKLADYLSEGELMMEFTMRWSCHDGHKDVFPYEWGAGVAGNAIAFSPAAGMEPDEDETSWITYADRVFGFEHWPSGWEWCFSPRWWVVDNTPKGAAKRIYWLLERGLPDNWMDQMLGRDHICYGDVA